ncbi:uncharacterized protein [Phyllobates terribilis]|uniref:uncharacterized protein n=1 Tax=Phyllobates terribilis TaxID=111132 RepID=UPI003CCAB828
MSQHAPGSGSVSTGSEYCRGCLERSAAMEQDPVTFEDVAIYFTRREWESLDEEQKTLYKEVMNDNYQMILSLNRPDIILNIQLGFEPYVQSKSERDCTGSRPEKNVNDGSCFPEGCGDTTSSGGEVRRQRRYPRVNPIRWIKKDKKKKRRLSRSLRQISRRSEDMTESREYQVQTSPDKTTYELSTCSSPDPAGDPPDPAGDPPDEAAGKDLSSEDGAVAQSPLPMVKAATEVYGPPTMGCSHEEDDLNPALGNDAADYKDLTISETSDVPWKANNESPSKRATPKKEPVKKEKGSPPSKKKVSHRKKDRHVKFSEVVTMILIDHHHEEHSAESQGGEVKLRRTPLPICYSVNEKDKKKCSSAVFREDEIASDRALLKTAEETKQVSKGSHPDTAKRKKEGIVEGSGTSQRAPELKALSSTIKQKHEVHSMEINEVVNVRLLNTKIKDIKMDTCSTSAQPKSLPSGHEPRFVKSYSCSKCGKITHWSKLTVHQKENIERSVAHICRTCGHHTSRSSATPSAQAIHPLSLTTATAQTIPPLSTSTPSQTIPPLSLKIAPAHIIPPLSLTTAPAQTIPPLSLTTAPAHIIPPLSLTTAPAHIIPPLSLTTAPAQTIPPLSLTTAPAHIIPPLSRTTAPAHIIPPLSLTTAPAQTIPPLSTSAPSQTIPPLSLKIAPARIIPPLSLKIAPAPIIPLLSLTTAPAQAFCPLSLTTVPGSGESSSTVNLSQKISVCSFAQPNTEISSTEKKERRHKDETTEKTTEDLGSLITAGDHFKKPPDTAQHHTDVCSKCARLKLDLKLKPFTGSSANHPSSPDTSALDLTWSRIGSKDNKVASKSSSEQLGKNVDSKEHKVCRKCGEWFIPKQRNHPLSSDQEEKPAKSSLGVVQKTPGCPKAAITMHPTYMNISDPKRSLAAENHTSVKDCTKCGKRLAQHGTSSPEDPAEGAEKKCVLRLKKRKSLLEEIEPFQCKECRKTFTRHFTLLQHRSVHTGERPHSCKECGKSFRDGGYLKVHMRLHTKEKPYACSECGKCFGQNSALIRHQRIHTDEKPFKCGECLKRFSDRSTFRHHQLIHTGEKPFACSFCGKKFTQKAHVKRHEKTHTGERPFGCSMCEKRFIDRTKLRKHELIHTRRKV